MCSRQFWGPWSPEIRNMDSIKVQKIPPKKKKKGGQESPQALPAFPPLALELNSFLGTYGLDPQQKVAVRSSVLGLYWMQRVDCGEGSVESIILYSIIFSFLMMERQFPCVSCIQLLLRSQGVWPALLI